MCIRDSFAGGARLGAALVRDGSLPGWLADGSTAGEIARRSLSLVALGGLTSLAVITVGDLSLNAPLLMTTGAFALVYAVGTASAVRLLPRGWVRRGAMVGFVATLGLLALTGAHLLGPALIAAGALAWTAVRPAPRPAAPALV